MDVDRRDRSKREGGKRRNERQREQQKRNGQREVSMLVQVTCRNVSGMEGWAVERQVGPRPTLSISVYLPSCYLLSIEKQEGRRKEGTSMPRLSIVFLFFFVLAPRNCTVFAQTDRQEDTLAGRH